MPLKLLASVGVGGVGRREKLTTWKGRNRVKGGKKGNNQSYDWVFQKELIERFEYNRQ